LPPERYTLAFDTAAASCAAALLCGEKVLVSREETMARGQAERLLPMLEEVLAEAGIGWRDLAAIGVGIGPGNFTGIRLSVAAARGLALGLAIPAHGVDAFSALAFGRTGRLRTVVAGRPGFVHVQDFHGVVPHGPVRTIEVSALDTEADRPLVGQAAPGLIPEAHGFEPPALPRAEAIARVAAARGDGPAPRPAPLYLRPADAAPPRVAAPPVLP